MIVYLHTNGRTINLNLVKEIRLINKGVDIDGTCIYCDEYEVAQTLHDDITKALKAGKKAWIEAFTDQDKYTLLQRDVLNHRREREEREATAEVIDLIERKATKCFRVKAHLLVYVEGGMFSTAELKNRNIDATVYAENESVVRAWVNEHHGKISTLDISREENRDVFACYKQLPIPFYGFGCADNVKILDSKDYELEKETV